MAIGYRFLYLDERLVGFDNAQHVLSPTESTLMQMGGDYGITQPWADVAPSPPPPSGGGCLLLLAALVITNPAARLDPVMLAVRVLWVVAAGVFFYDARKAMRLTIGQIHQQGVAKRLGSLLQMAAVVMGGYAAVDVG